MANFITCLFHINDFRQMIALVFKINFLKEKCSRSKTKTHSEWQIYRIMTHILRNYQQNIDRADYT